MIEPQAIAAAFRSLQAGDAAGALAAANRIVASAPSSARGHLAAGLALRMLGRHDESRASLARAATLDPSDYAAAFELGMAFELLGNAAAALPQFERAASLRPAFLPARHALGMSLYRMGRVAEAIEHLGAAASASPQDAGRHVDLAQALLDARRLDEAQQALDRALASQPDHVGALRHCGRLNVGRGEFARAAAFFAAAVERDPADAVLPIFLFQTELLLEHWERGWAAYRRRATRRALETTLLECKRSARIPAVAELAGKSVTLIAEQGLGDTLFFLRFAPTLKRVAKLHFAGDARLHPLLGRTGLFESLRATADIASDAADAVLLTGDLPEACRDSGDPCPASLRIAPDPARLAAWRMKLEGLGPKPWTGITWRSGTPHKDLAFALHKAMSIPDLTASLRPLGGTVVALQRNPAAGELDSASRALEAGVHDFSAINDDLEDALAVTALLDRHVGVSSTNMHLAAAAGKTADVLVPFPPEWRWGLGSESPWFKGFRVFRQTAGGDWSQALAALAASASAGNSSRA